MIYDVNGRALNGMGDEMELSYAYDSTTATNYTALRIFQTKRDGTKQLPFIRYPGFMKIEDFAAAEKWEIITNAGLGWDGEIDGVAIQNGVVINNSPASYHAGSIPLTIDANGNLGTASATATGTELVNNGIVFATCGFCPIIENYTPTVSFPTVDHVSHFNSKAKRTIIGQFGNVDYALIVCAEGADNSSGWKLSEAQGICQKLGLKFAYNLDGGRSSSMYLKKHVVYDFMAGTTRIIPSFIVFNGTDTYSIPT